MLGDAAHFKVGEGTLPGVCPTAIQMGQYAARIIREEVAGRRPAQGFALSPEGQRAAKPPAAGRTPFSYWDKGQLAVIGRGRAVADLGRLQFGGFFAWLAWIFVHIFFLIGFRNRVLVLFQWAYSYFTYRRGARIITGEIGPTTPTRPVSEFPTRPPDGMAARAQTPVAGTAGP